MIPHILTLNAGSSSIKFGLYRLPEDTGNEPPIVHAGSWTASAPDRGSRSRTRVAVS